MAPTFAPARLRRSVTCCPPRGLRPPLGGHAAGGLCPPRSCQPASRSVTLCSTSPLKRLPTPAGKALLCLFASVPPEGVAAPPRRRKAAPTPAGRRKTKHRFVLRSRNRRRRGEASQSCFRLRPLPVGARAAHNRRRRCRKRHGRDESRPNGLYTGAGCKTRRGARQLV